MLKRFKNVHKKNEKERVELLMKKGIFDGKAQRICLSINREIPYPYQLY